MVYFVSVEPRGASLDERCAPAAQEGGVRLTIAAARADDAGVYTLRIKIYGIWRIMSLSCFTDIPESFYTGSSVLGV
ncbi:hypothetical protein EVAR_69113_1 [Eumeta japonica]|uniref:Uncharacterized protein n=1 Tax=Eumeta variegata TaxID=151549 RepID=A0A4C1SL28_EUMVA|nr:hypothetical protein EVAR_69113_1 [Eumeta japonica]